MAAAPAQSAPSPSATRQFLRLLRYVRPYWLALTSSVILLALVGALEAFRILLIGPIFGRVLQPETASHDLKIFGIPFTKYVNLQHLVPPHFQNPWTVVAFALVSATILKGLA